ncbi:GNAT family N-acetyltransferase [Thermococcus sp.]
MVVIREARPRDKSFIEEMTAVMGGDYLPEVFEEWLGDGGFYVLEVDGKVVGTAKLTRFPCGVLWMEGLRVHPDYRGRGLGKRLHSFLIEKALELSRRSHYRAVEFATNPLRSLSAVLAAKTGFSTVAEFRRFNVSTEDFIPEEPVSSELALGDVEGLSRLPVGWYFLKPCGEGIAWVNERTEVYEIDGVKFIAPAGGTTFAPVRTDVRSLKLTLPAMAWVARERGAETFTVVIPAEQRVNPAELRLTPREESGRADIAVFSKELV